MDTNRKMCLLLMSALLFSSVLAQTSSPSEEESSLNDDRHLESSSGQDSLTPNSQRRSGYGFHSGLHYHVPSSPGFAYAAAHRPFYSDLTPVVKYPVIKPYLTTPVLHHARPHYHLHHGGASVSSYNVNYPRFPLYRPVLKFPTVIKPTVLSSPPLFASPSVFAQKPIIPIALNPVLPTAARPSVIVPQAFNPSILAGLNPQFVPVSVSNGAVFTNYPALAPTPLAPSAWKPIAVPTVPTTFAVQRPSISILPPLGAPSSTIATLADPIHGHHHHFQPQVPTTLASPAVSDVLHDQHHHHHNLITGKRQ